MQARRRPGVVVLAVLGRRATLRGAALGDGHADLVTAAYAEGQLFVRLGRGDRTFDTGVAYTVGREPISVALDDLDGDGDLDVACGQWGGGVRVLLGAGDGTLKSCPEFHSGRLFSREARRAKPTKGAVSSREARSGNRSPARGGRLMDTP